VAAIAAALVRRRQPYRHCFGRLHSTPAGWSTLARNVVLAGVAVPVAVAGPRLGVSAWSRSLSHEQVRVLAGVLASVVLAAQATLAWRLLRRHGELLIRVRELEGRPGSEPSVLPIGDPAPSFDLPGLLGERISLAGLLSAGRGVLLVFTDPRCCSTLGFTVISDTPC
jgi:hypothetical protein